MEEAAKEVAHAKAETKRLKRFKRLARMEVRELGRKDLRAAIAEYQASGLVEFAEPDYVVQTSAVPNDPLYLNGYLWQHDNTGQSGGVLDADLDAREAWETRTDSTAVVTVIDTGVRYTHEDLEANMWRNPGEIAGNQIDDDGNGYVDDVFGINAITDSGNPMDDHGHGTHVAGSIAAAGNNGKGVVGVAWAAKIMACKFMSQDGEGYILTRSRRSITLVSKAPRFSTIAGAAAAILKLCSMHSTGAGRREQSASLLRATKRITTMRYPAIRLTTHSRLSWP